ncbi:MAG: Tim44/TimA family putative adaptor protein [Pseudomonadota bacterium]
MGQGLIEIIFLAIVAAVIFRQLFSVLGRKSGNEHEQPRTIQTRRPREVETAQRADNGMPGGEPRPLDAPENEAYFDTTDQDLVTALDELRSIDRSFDPKGFLDGARMAYEIIVVSFAKGDKKALKPLLSKEVLRNFEQVIDERAERGETVETTFVGIKSSKITGAGLRGRLMEVTVKFVGELISVTKNKDGAVIEGDPTSVYDVTDVWTFCRDSRSSDPNWQLVGTATS